jgi:hypothetical protein
MERLLFSQSLGGNKYINPNPEPFFFFGPSIWQIFNLSDSPILYDCTITQYIMLFGEDRYMHNIGISSLL